MRTGLDRCARGGSCARRSDDAAVASDVAVVYEVSTRWFRGDSGDVLRGRSRIGGGAWGMDRPSGLQLSNVLLDRQGRRGSWTLGRRGRRWMKKTGATGMRCRRSRMAWGMMSAPSLLSISLTRTGGMLGTPSYATPERQGGWPMRSLDALLAARGRAAKPTGNVVSAGARRTSAGPSLPTEAGHVAPADRHDPPLAEHPLQNHPV